MLERGTLLRERYRILRVIGAGGMGRVYLAEDERLPGRKCAVKEIRYLGAFPQEWHDELRAQFMREATVLARLDHPNLPKVSDFFSEAEADYLVMDYVPGKDLMTLLYEAQEAGRSLPLADVLAWMDQLMDALVYLHTQNPPIVHRDIKPANIKVTPTGLVKLVDFGLVKEMVVGESTITVIHGKGTLPYTPLEQYAGEGGRTDPRSDIYALAATMYHLLTGHPPPSARERFLNPRVLKPLREYNPAIPPQVEQAVLWGMALHPDERPPSVAVFREALRGAAAPLRPAQESTQAQPGWWRYWPEALLFLLALAGLMLAYQVFR